MNKPREAVVYSEFITRREAECHGRAAGRTRETRGKRNNGNLMMEYRRYNHTDELTDKDSGKTQLNSGGHGG